MFMEKFFLSYREAKSSSDWRYECASDIDRLDDFDFSVNARVFCRLNNTSSCAIESFGKVGGAFVSYMVNFVPLRTSVEYVDREIREHS